MQLKLNNITKKFGENTVLRNISHTAEGIKCLSIIGPSGGGKSTLLRVLAGLVIPENGSVTINSQEMNFTTKGLLDHRRSIGVVFQNYNLFPHLTALENIVLPMVKVHKITRTEATERAIECLTRFKMQDHMYKTPGELSGGQSQRVAIARAVVNNPRLIILDEPTSALDPEMTSEVLEVIGELRESGTDLLLVTHHMEFARHVSDHILFLSDGEIIESGEPKKVFENSKHSVCKSFFEKVMPF